MTDIKIEPSKTPIIEPCPMPGCGGECEVYLTLDKNGGKQRGVHCTKCRYMSQTSGKFPDKAIAAHNQLCENARLGKAAKGKHIVTNQLMKVIEMNNEMARRARKLCENPPEWPPTGMDKGRNRAHEIGWEECRQACLDRLTEATSPDMLINGWHDAV